MNNRKLALSILGGICGFLGAMFFSRGVEPISEEIDRCEKNDIIPTNVEECNTNNVIFDERFEYKNEDQSDVFLITEDQFGYEDDFEKDTLIYRDGKLWDSNDEEVEGEDILNIVKNEDNFEILYVRNLEIDMDFEILNEN